MKVWVLFEQKKIEVRNECLFVENGNRVYAVCLESEVNFFVPKIYEMNT